ncbi:GH16357 [Drosophila grimshawi]|uniref:Gamma-tubulin complex component n=2 Tax=Drosophila grimshawi TaxID=7222 RepID=B4IYT3_DROGR|nr:GH16357 [Drosophila grimshawi]
MHYLNATDDAISRSRADEQTNAAAAVFKSWELPMLPKHPTRHKTEKSPTGNRLPPSKPITPHTVGKHLNFNSSDCGSRFTATSNILSSEYPQSKAIGEKSNWNSQDADFNGFPVGHVSNLLWDYCKVEGKGLGPKQKLASLPLDSQENLILNDLIYCLSGIRGEYIEPQPRDLQAKGMDKYKTHFSVDKELDKSLKEIVHEILPLASHFMGIQRAVAATEQSGQVINALNAELIRIRKDFYVLLAQAEEQLSDKELTLAKLHYYLQPTTWLMDDIFITVSEIQLQHLQGGAVLSHLCARIKQLESDQSTRNAFIELASKAAVPYMKMLKLWIQKGVIVDSKREFLVEDNKNIHLAELSPDEYWEKRYTLRSKCIPTFLEMQSDRILRTGKYIQVIRQCGKQVMNTMVFNLEFDPTNDQHVPVINDAYFFAAHTLYDVLINDHDLMGHMQSIKRYLLLNQGDFIMQFMDVCEEELSKNIGSVQPLKLDNLLGLSLSLSSARSDPHKNNLHCGLLPLDYFTQMSQLNKQDQEEPSGFQSFVFTYEVNWPISLVINRTVMTQYQMLFRQLFYCKHVERQLCKSWKEYSMKITPHESCVLMVRQRMMNTIQDLEYYMMVEIIEPNWKIFIEKMKKIQNLEMLLSLQSDFLYLCLRDNMLAESSHFNRAVFKLCEICLKFCKFIQCESKPDEMIAFGEQVKCFDVEFTDTLITFLKQIKKLSGNNITDRCMNLLHRINFNGFYTDKILNDY